MRIIRVIFPLIVFMFAAVSLHAADFEPFDIGSAEARGQILVVMEKTEFKLAVLQGITDEFGDESVRFRIEPYQSYSEIVESDWDAIVVMAPIYADDIPPQSREFLSSLSSPEGAILLSTSGNAEVPVQMRQIDTLSSSSLKLQRVDLLAREIVDFLQERL